LELKGFYVVVVVDDDDDSSYKALEVCAASFTID
jgi:hypothetical protein